MPSQKNHPEAPTITLPASLLLNSSLSSRISSSSTNQKPNTANSSTMNTTKSTTTTVSSFGSSKVLAGTTNTSPQFFSSSTSTTTTTTALAPSRKIHLVTLEEKQRDQKQQQFSSSILPTTTRSDLSEPKVPSSSMNGKKKKKKQQPNSVQKNDLQLPQTTPPPVPSISTCHLNSSTPQKRKTSSSSSPNIHPQQPQQPTLSPMIEFEEDGILEDRASVLTNSARSRAPSHTLTLSPRSASTLSSASSDDGMMTRGHTMIQSYEEDGHDDEDELMNGSNRSSKTLKKTNQRLKKRVQSLTAEHAEALQKLTLLQEELNTLKQSYETELSKTKHMSQVIIGDLKTRNDNLKEKLKKQKEELEHLENSVITPLRTSFESKKLEFENVIVTLKDQLQNLSAAEERKYQEILTEQETDFTTKMELLKKEHEQTLQRQHQLKIELEAIVTRRTEEIISLKLTIESTQQLLTHTRTNYETQIEKLTTQFKTREDELLHLLKLKEEENQRLLQENALLRDKLKEKPQFSHASNNDNDMVKKFANLIPKQYPGSSLKSVRSSQPSTAMASSILQFLQGKRCVQL
ncbi:hypothetical protein C9374_005912 [Naegleria lovaniensis]|uniref:Uncharacterized protein n=1 Tax=Naegleria lovaniensis TaxID=51637 RepID=A0AA88GKY4_NAELO|nr:uncharacterized protein C9374_005912 [Naegleria lovaniensis]KAG2382120.1 hypothetical protein C9374_005912 [Naegleria lovaniensis]